MLPWRETWWWSVNEWKWNLSDGSSAAIIGLAVPAGPAGGQKNVWCPFQRFCWKSIAKSKGEMRLGSSAISLYVGNWNTIRSPHSYRRNQGRDGLTSKENVSLSAVGLSGVQIAAHQKGVIFYNYCSLARAKRFIFVWFGVGVSREERENYSGFRAIVCNMRNQHFRAVDSRFSQRKAVDLLLHETMQVHNLSNKRTSRTKIEITLEWWT